jgi:rod shape-determining protein MreB
MTKNSSQYARDVFNLLVGERVAEQVKIRIGSAIDLEENLEMEMRGRDLITGLPKQVIVNEGQIREALAKSVKTIIESIKATLEVTPPELVADIYERGIVLAGGGSLLRGLDRIIAKESAIPVRLAEDPLTAVARGTGALLDDAELLAEITLPSTSDENYI